jgi:hypothetical protein
MPTIGGTIGGGTAPTMGRVDRTTGDLGLNTITWTDMPGGFTITLPAAAGDIVQAGVSYYTAGGNYLYMDAVTVVSGSSVNNLSLGVAETSTGNGVQTWCGLPGENVVGGVIAYQLTAGDVSGGQVTLQLRYRTETTVYKSVSGLANAPFTIWARRG